MAPHSKPQVDNGEDILNQQLQLELELPSSVNLKQRKTPTWKTEAEDESSSGQVAPSPVPLKSAHYSYSCCSHSLLPGWLQDNAYLVQSHRPPLNSYTACLKSVFSIHSETGNIWSHLIGFKIYILLAVSFWTSPASIISVEEKLVFSSYFVGVLICMAFSTLFHTFSCHSKSVGGFLIRLDYCGISMLIMAGFFPWIYYGFYCETMIRNLYAGLSLATGSVCLFMSFTEGITHSGSRLIRTAVFTGCGLVYVVPALHFLVINGLDDPVARRAFVWLSRVSVVCVGKAVIYACRVPERWMPGRCDIWFQSHQIFHVLVVVATMVNYLGVRELSLYRMSQPADFCAMR